MCCCGKPTRNGEPGAYSWEGKTRGTYPISAPALASGDVLLFDEPGRCGGIDSHAYHFRVVKTPSGSLGLVVRHGGGEVRIDYLSNKRALEAALGALDSDGRYWVLCALFHAREDAARKAVDREGRVWREAAAEKRIRTRKLPARGVVKVWVEPRKIARECFCKPGAVCVCSGTRIDGGEVF